jgi:isopentenyl-diphosphate delta-isomerase type 1
MKDDQRALFIVVDESDTVLGYKTRYTCHHSPEIIHRAVDVVLYNTKGEILLQKRSKQKDTFPGYLTVSASGHVDKGESYEDAIYREIHEELGIQNPKNIALTKKGKYIVRLEHESEMTALFSGVYDGEIVPAEDEVESVLFVLPDKLSHLKKTITPGALAAFYKLGLL